MLPRAYVNVIRDSVEVRINECPSKATEDRSKEFHLFKPY